MKVEAPEVATSESGVVVTHGLYSVRVTLASTAKAEEEGEEREKDVLGGGAAARALTELRHSKWFAVTAANLPSCVECIRIVKARPGSTLNLAGFVRIWRHIPPLKIK